jgi:putative transposase
MDVAPDAVPDLPDTQTMTVVAKAVVNDDRTALLLGLLGFSATKLWNTALWHSREVWNDTGKILSYEKLDKAIKLGKPVWYRRLHSQSAQAVLEELGRSYKSWFALRKKGDTRAKPPGFRRKDTLSPVTFKQLAVNWDPRMSTVRLSIPKDTYGRQFIYLRLKLPEDRVLTNESIRMARLVYQSGEWFVHLVCTVKLPALKGAGRSMALDLNVKNLAGSACSNGTTAVWSGGELSALERYFDKAKSRTTKSTSRRSLALNRKRSRQRRHLLHCFTKSVVRDADARGVSTIIVGYPKDIRDGKDHGANTNQKLHRWPYKLVFDMLKYKGRLLGIQVIDIGEEYTSQTCSACGTVDKSSRVHRGLYVCRECGAVMHADINAAVNILRKHTDARYLPREMGSLWSSGCLAQPAVNRFAWRKTRPAGTAHKPGTWQTTLPHPQTESVPVARS